MLAAGAEAPAALEQSRPFGRGQGGQVIKGPFPRAAEGGGIATIHTGRPTKAKPRLQATPEKILQAFNTWAFKREQPDSVPRLLEVVAGAAHLARPVPFVLYWGKGPRHGLAEPDTACLDYLASLGSRVRQAYEPGA